MPYYPTPGRGISTAGLNKDNGWGSRNASGQVIDFVHAGDAGIDHTAGLWKSGLDTVNNPRVTTRNVTPIAGTTATVTWTTLIANPPGTVSRRVAGATSAAWTTPLTEAAGNKTSHSVALTGLTVDTTYEYLITQPALTAAGNTVEIMGTFKTAAALLRMQEQLGEPVLNDTAQAPPLRQVGPGREQITPPFEMNNLKTVTGPKGATVTWRTAVYADGTVMYRPVGGQSLTADEEGVKRLNHSVTLTGLQPNTEYEVAVISADAQGNTAEAGPIRVRTTRG